MNTNKAHIAKCALLVDNDDPDVLLVTLQRAEMPILVGLHHGHELNSIAAAYACRPAEVLSYAAALVVDLGQEYRFDIHVEKGTLPTIDMINLWIRQLVAFVSERTEDETITLYDLLSCREREEARVVLQLFEVQSRVNKRLKELNNGNIQSRPCA